MSRNARGTAETRVGRIMFGWVFARRIVAARWGRSSLTRLEGVNNSVKLSSGLSHSFGVTGFRRAGVDRFPIR